MLLGCSIPSLRDFCLPLLPLLLVTGIARAGDSKPRCFLDVPLYDATGNRLSVRVVAVTLQGERIDLLTARDPEIRMTVKGDRLYFPENLIGKRPFDITVADQRGSRVTKTVALTDCEQRASFERGEQDSGADVGWSTVTG